MKWEEDGVESCLALSGMIPTRSLTRMSIIQVAMTSIYLVSTVSEEGLLSMQHVHILSSMSASIEGSS